MTFSVTVVPGEGIGPEITNSTLQVLKASGADLDFHILNSATTDRSKFVDQVVDSALRTDALLKGPLGTPLGGGFKSLNVALRNKLQLYANIRPIKELPGLGTRVIPLQRNKDKIIDFLLVRENMEDLYIGHERKIAPGVVVADKMMTVEGCEQIIRASFELARQRKLGGDTRKVCCAHKANILKQSEGMLLNLFRKIAPEYPDIVSQDLIVDNAAQQIVINPHDLEVIFMSNLHGDILSDEAAGIIGGLGLAGSANVGNNHAMFEAVHGTAPDIAGKGIANPTSLMLSSVMMLSYLGEQESATRMLNAIYSVYEKGEYRTGDLKRSSAEAATTEQFAAAVVRAVENNESCQDERFQVASLPNFRLPKSSVGENMNALAVVNSGIEIQAVGPSLSSIPRQLMEALGQRFNMNVLEYSVIGKITRAVFSSANQILSGSITVAFLDAAMEMGVDVRSFHMLAACSE